MTNNLFQILSILICCSAIPFYFYIKNRRCDQKLDERYKEIDELLNNIDQTIEQLACWTEKKEQTTAEIMKILNKNLLDFNKLPTDFEKLIVNYNEFKNSSTNLNKTLFNGFSPYSTIDKKFINADLMFD